MLLPLQFILRVPCFCCHRSNIFKYLSTVLWVELHLLLAILTAQLFWSHIMTHHVPPGKRLYSSQRNAAKRFCLICDKEKRNHTKVKANSSGNIKMKVKNSESRMKYPSPQCIKLLTFITQFLWMLVSYALVCSCSKFSTSTWSSYGQHYLNLDIIQTETLRDSAGKPHPYNSTR